MTDDRPNRACEVLGTLAVAVLLYAMVSCPHSPAAVAATSCDPAVWHPAGPAYVLRVMPSGYGDHNAPEGYRIYYRRADEGRPWSLFGEYPNEDHEGVAWNRAVDLGVPPLRRMDATPGVVFEFEARAYNAVGESPPTTPPTRSCFPRYCYPAEEPSACGESAP